MIIDLLSAADWGQ